MKPFVHKLFIGTMALIVLAALVYLVYTGFEYYNTPLEERFYHPDYDSLKPSGVLGHGMGILGSLFMIIGVSAYMLRKRMRYMSRLGKLKHWLEFHIFLCILGPILVLFHTSFKFGGIVSISFWSMVAVFLSGIIGRFIYIQIPRTIEGRELSLNEIRNMKSDLSKLLQTEYSLDQAVIETILESTRKSIDPDHVKPVSMRRIKAVLKQIKLSRIQRTGVLRLVKNEITLNRRIERLETMQKLFNYWHVVHLPFALIMLIIMVIHIAVTVVFGYKWIF